MQNANLLDDMKDPDPFTGIVNLDDLEFSEEQQKDGYGASTLNPNKDDDRRLFQERRAVFSWDTDLAYADQPNPIPKPTELQFPDHYYKVMGGIVVIH